MNTDNGITKIATASNNWNVYINDNGDGVYNKDNDSIYMVNDNDAETNNDVKYDYNPAAALKELEKLGISNIDGKRVDKIAYQCKQMELIKKHADRGNGKSMFAALENIKNMAEEHDIPIDEKTLNKIENKGYKNGYKHSFRDAKSRAETGYVDYMQEALDASVWYSIKLDKKTSSETKRYDRIQKLGYKNAVPLRLLQAENRALNCQNYTDFTEVKTYIKEARKYAELSGVKIDETQINKIINTANKTLTYTK